MNRLILVVLLICIGCGEITKDDIREIVNGRRGYPVYTEYEEDTSSRYQLEICNQAVRMCNERIFFECEEIMGSCDTVLQRSRIHAIRQMLKDELSHRADLVNRAVAS